jgi:MFS family permease
VPVSQGSEPTDRSGLAASRASLGGLSWLNFLTALMQTGFGAFLAVYLTNQQWSRTDIGFALSAGTAAAMVSQVPGGMLVDWAPIKRLAAAGAVLGIMAAALLIAAVPLRWPVYAAQVLQGVAAAVLTPAIAALTLALSRQEKLGERLGRNVRFAAIGSALAAGITGLVGAWMSLRAMFWLAALCGLPCLAAIARIRTVDMETGYLRTSHLAAVDRWHRTTPPKRILQVCRDPALLVFAACVALFQFGNAALLPTAAGALARAYGQLPDLMVSGMAPTLPHVRMHIDDLLVAAWIVVPQLLAALLSPWLGRYAQQHGRRLVLLAGFAVLPLRALLFASDGGPGMMVIFQMLDGVSAAVLGVMIPLVVADITRGGGRFNLAIGIVGLAGGVGGALSTAAAGVLSDWIGDVGTFIALGGAGLCACGLLVAAMPETRIVSSGGGVKPRQA